MIRVTLASGLSTLAAGLMLLTPVHAEEIKDVKVTVVDGFKVEKLYDVDKPTQGSWVGMTVDPKGRIITTDQYGGIYRVTVNPDVSVEKLNVKAGHAHGTLYAFDSLYVLTGEKEGKGLYRLQDTTGDDQYDKEEKLISFNSSGEHGVHSLVLSPDKNFIYLVGGNNTDIPGSATAFRMVKGGWNEDHLLPRMADGRGHNRGRMAPGGFIMKLDPEAKTQEIITTGFRNEFDAAFNMEGELFAWDADMEWDVGAPWYRPTRVNHVVSGAEWGWRNGSGKWPEYYPDSLPAIVNIGPASPTGVTSGEGAHFPEEYQRAIFINDWTYGTMYAIHLEEDGASYKATSEEFLSGKPLPLTDVIIHPDGNMYFMVGGRRTQSALYRVSYVGRQSTKPVSAKEVNPLITLRRELENLHLDGTGEEAVPEALKYIGHDDRYIRFAARVALEKQPANLWKGELSKANSPWATIELAVALARTGEQSDQSTLLKALNTLNIAKLETPQVLAAMRAYQLAFTRLGKPSDDDAKSVIASLDEFYPHQDNYVTRELAQILLYLNAPGAVSRTVQQVLSATDIQTKILDDSILERNDRYATAARRTEQFRPNSQQFYLAFSLRSIKEGWTDADRASYFSWFPRAKTWQGGNSFGAFVDNTLKEALANVSDETKRAEYAAMASKKMEQPRAIESPKGPGREWTVDEAVKEVEGHLADRNFKSGENLFHATACASCHRFAGQGMGIGPDITGAVNRYSVRDMLENIIEPSKVVSDIYGNMHFKMKDGSEVIGRLGGEEDGKIHIMTNPYSSDITVTINSADVISKEPYEVSPMPAGLLNSLNPEELRDLIAYIFAKGDPEHEYFSGISSYTPALEKAKDLFNGKDLDGWKGNTDLWSVKDGVIHGSTRGKPIKGNTFLIWDGGEVEDFYLTYEAKVNDNNSGVMYRSEILDDKKFVMKGYQADLHPNPPYLAMIYEERGRGILITRGQKMVIDETGKKTVLSSEKPKPIDITQWQKYEIIAKGNHVIQKVNGEIAIDIVDNAPVRIKKGHIGLQIHQGKEMDCQFRNIKLITF
jgi:putative heme-binding domain-containing protein